MSKRYPGSIEWHRDRLRVRLCLGGKRYRYTLSTTDKKQAAEFARTKYAELARQHRRTGSGLPGPVRCADLFEQFEREEMPTKSPGCQRSYGDSLKAIRLYFEHEASNPLVDQVRAADVERFMTWRRAHRVVTREQEDGTKKLESIEGRVHERTVGKDRMVLHAIFALADRLEVRDGNPVARTKAPKYDPRTPVLLTAQEYEALLTACEDPVLRLYVLTLGETGMRCQSEALWLKFEDVDLDGSFLWVASGRDNHRTKSGKGRHVPMTERLRAAMREHFARHRLTGFSEYVFHHTISRRRHKAGDRIDSLRLGSLAAARRAKLPVGWHVHDLRHRRVTTWLAQGADVVKVKEAVGHSDLRTTMGYTHLAREHLRSLVEAPPKPHAAKA